MSRDYPNCDHQSIGHNDGPCCAVCEIAGRLEQLESRHRQAVEALLGAIDEAIDTVQGMCDPADDDDPTPTVLARWKAIRDRAREDM